MRRSLETFLNQEDMNTFITLLTSLRLTFVTTMDLIFSILSQAWLHSVKIRSCGSNDSHPCGADCNTDMILEKKLITQYELGKL